MFWDWREQAAEKKVKSEARHSNRIKICSVDVAKIITIYCFCSSSSFFHEKRQKYNMRRSNFCLLFFQLKTMIYNTGIRGNEKKKLRSMYGRYFSLFVFLLFHFIRNILFHRHCSLSIFSVAFFPLFLILHRFLWHIPTFYRFWSIPAILLFSLLLLLVSPVVLVLFYI